jgi:imidazolonepropionase
MRTVKWDRVWIGADLATLDGDIGIGHIADAVLAVRDGAIAWLGNREQLATLDWSADETIDASGRWITPGLIDCHTHLVYAGDRSNEFALRQQGATYEEIARAGGGILSTVRATRQASEDALLDASMPRALALRAEGVTTLEIKSGYGLDLATELKMLRVARRLGDRFQISVITTFLGAHTVPPEFANRADDYVEHVCSEMLPAAVREGLADALDVFCERIAFSPAQTRRIFSAAQQLGLPLHLHADQLSDLSGAALAAELGALSADHLEHASFASLQEMARRGTIAGLLPGAYYYLREKKLPPIEHLRALGIPIAVATDCNPGTSPFASLLLVMNMACVLFGLTTDEALRGVTCNAARAVGLAHDRGSLRTGMRADLAIWRLRHPEQLCSEVGMHRPEEVIVAGKTICATGMRQRL